MSDQTLLLAGLPESGKTTYLAALFHLLRSGEANQAELLMPSLPADHEYLMEVESTWLRFEPMGRTVTTVPGGASIALTRDGSSASLAIPDIRGEDLEHLWEYGVQADHLAEVSSRATGVLLFVRADDVRPPGFLNEHVQPVDSIDFELGDWDPSDAPTQTKLSDVVEQLGFLHRGLPVAVVVTAWDTVTTEDVADAWMQRRLPLLWQQLNVSRSRLAVFGVSAQGGSLDNDDDRRALAGLPSTTSRIADPTVRRGDDLTAPIAWLIAEGG